MASYAALVCLMNVLNRIQHPTCPASLHTSQIQSLFNKASLLVEILETDSQRLSKDLERKIMDAAYAAEDMIDSYVVDQILSRSSRNGDDLTFQNLEKVILEMDMITQEAMGVQTEKSHNDQLPRSFERVAPSLPWSGRIKMVGMDEELIRLMDQLTSDKSSRQIIPVIGMGGIGKTTLVHNVYNHPYVANHFQIQAWVTISQDYIVGTIIRTLLCSIGVDVNGEMGDEQLGEKLHRELWGRKYLIVLDDMWSDVAWDEIRRFIPDNVNGSRILLTTRILSVARNAGTCDSPYEMACLGNEESWELLSDCVFSGEACAPDLKKLGKKIAKSCKGLPLAIVVIGGHLKNSEMTAEYWEGFAESVSSIANTEHGHCLEILSLSYNNLPIHLKPCFLFMATFKEDTEIPVSRLIKLWVADGFLKHRDGRSLEDVGLECLKDLIGRNLVMVKKQDVSGNITSCSVHDLLREFCQREAQNEKFLCVIKEGDIVNLPQSERRLVCHLSSDGPRKELPHSFSCKYGSSQPASGFRMLQAIYIDKDRNFKVDAAELIQLHYLAVDCSIGIPLLKSSISLFWNLETLIFYGTSGTLNLPPAFWELHNLRHFLVSRRGKVVLPDPRGARVGCVLDKLQTLSGVKIFKHGVAEVLKLIPNLKELGTSYDGRHETKTSGPPDTFLNLASLQKLEVLSIEIEYFKWMTRYFSEECGICVYNREWGNLAFSGNIRKLVLRDCPITWDNMTVVGSLPNLEVLKLKRHQFAGKKWNSNEGEFQSLKLLLIDGCEIRTWRAENYHFPSLRHLILRHLNLKEIPCGIGDIASLERIELRSSKKSAIMSAKELLDERESMGIDDLHISAHYWYTSDDDMEELEKLANPNFDIGFTWTQHLSDDESENEEDEEEEEYRELQDGKEDVEEAAEISCFMSVLYCLFRSCIRTM